MSDNTTLVIPHIPKTGGQSLRHYFNEHLVFNQTFIHLGPWGRKVCHQNDLTVWQEQSYKDRHKAKVIFGHQAHRDEIRQLIPDNQLVYAINFREPAERWVSDYNFKLANETLPPNTGFWDYYHSCSNRNMLSIFVWCHYMQQRSLPSEEMVDKVITELTSFDCIGVLERYQDFLDWVSTFLGLPKVEKKYNVSGVSHAKKMDITEDIRARIKKDCAADYRLYDWVLEHAI